MPTPIDDGSRICFQIQLPDLLEYRAALMGQLNQLGYWFAWSHTQADYSDIPQKNVDVAELWVGLVADASFEVCMSFCEQLIACITSNPATQAAIRDFVLNDTIINQHIQTIARTGVPLPEVELPIIQGCEPNAAWGAVNGLIDQMDVNNTDFFEMFELESNRIEQISTLISAIPKFQELPVDEALMFTNQLFENIAENYAGAMTTELKNRYKCDLFCIGINDPDCTLKFDAMYNYFKDRISGTFTIESAFAVVIQFLAEGTFTGSLVADFMFMMQIEVLRSANNFLGLDTLSLNTVASLGALNPSSGWELLCDDCVVPVWCHKINLKDGYPDIVLSYTEDGFVYDNQWTSGVGITGARTGLLDECIVKLVLPLPARVTNITFTTGSVSNPTAAYAFGWPNGDTSYPAQPMTAGVNIPVFTIDEDCDFVMFGVDRGGGDRTPIAPLEEVTITGTGPNPWGSNNC